MENICFLIDDVKRKTDDDEEVAKKRIDDLERTIKNAINISIGKDIEGKKKWLRSEFDRINELTCSNIHDSDKVQIAMGNLDKAVLIISDISEANAYINFETGRAIKAGKPTIILTDDLESIQALKGKRAKHIIYYDLEKPNALNKLQDELVSKFDEIEIYVKDWERLLSLINVPIYTLDHKGNIDFFNRTAENFFRIEAKGIMGKSPVVFMNMILKAGIIHKNYIDLFNEQIKLAKISLAEAQREDNEERLRVREISPAPLLYDFGNGILKLSHLEIYNGGTDGSICIFWGVEKAGPERRAYMLLEVLKDLTREN